MTLPLPASPTHICVLRLSALGDVCNLVPAIRAMQHQWPDARITWIVGRAEHSLLSGLDGVELVVYDKSTGLMGMYALWRQLSKTPFDVLVHAQQSLRASLLSLGLKARLRLGFDPLRAKDHQTWFTNCQLPVHANAHVLTTFVDFARALGVSDAYTARNRLEWRIPVDAKAEVEAAQLTGGVRYMVLSPCATPRRRNYRNWTATGYAAVIDYAYRHYGLITVLSGGRRVEEQAMITEIVQQVRQQSGIDHPKWLIDASGKTSLKGLLALIRHARVVIAPDSGPVHMANALGTPVLGLFATTNPDRAAPYLWRDYVVDRYPDAVARYMGKAMTEIRWGARVRHPDAMQLITIDDVTSGLTQLLAATTQRDQDDRPLFGKDIPSATRQKENMTL